MGDSRDWTGCRLGPYFLDRRYPDFDESDGQLYAARHVDTGRPALVLVPEAQGTWTPRGDWSVRVVSQRSPPFLATELECPPPASARALSDMNLGFIRLAGAVASIEDQREANEAFTQSPSRRGLQGWRHLRTGALAAGALLLVFLVFWPRVLDPSTGGTLVSESSRIPSTLWSDLAEGGPVIGYPMPAVAFAEQMKPPCVGGGSVEIRGGCWIETPEKPPCQETAEHQGKCYVPVRAKKPERRSVTP
ncbi:protein kinase [Archangium primigenium]|uniref:protein kinase n=1 Tax=[Archangium] primigenium TaxID=2792470 RepID=UPI00195D3B01|nr:protein kinase [Archangium primigenium]MBM7116555.1 protein kinase [Archangium primigenium]